MTKQQIRFCTTPDGVRIAYALVGEGPPVLYVNGWPEHLELEWEQPFAQAFLARLAQGCTLVRYDMRGSGLSDRDVPAVSLEDLDRDLETVANQIGAAQIPLLALGMLAGPLALRFAARSPNRIARVVVVGGFVQGEPILSEARRRGSGSRHARLRRSDRALRTRPQARRVPTGRHVPPNRGRYRRSVGAGRSAHPDVARALVDRG